MEYRYLGKTQLRTSVIGVGVEHLKNVSTEEIERIFTTALDKGVNYFDLVWSFPNILDGLKAALQNHSKPVISFHLGSCNSKGEYFRSRDPFECEKHFRLQLEKLNLNSASLVNIHYIANSKIWEEIKQKGIVSLAERLKQEGLAEAISLSTHAPEVMRLAVGHPLIDCVMHQVNVANHSHTALHHSLEVCKAHGISVVAMKPFAGGELLKVGKKVKIPAYKTGWKTLTVEVPKDTTSIRLLSYVLDQPAVCTAVTGISSVEQLHANLAYLNASTEERDYFGLLASLERKNQQTAPI